MHQLANKPYIFLRIEQSVAGDEFFYMLSALEIRFKIFDSVKTSSF